MRGICCECQTEHDVRYAPTRGIDGYPCIDCEYVMVYHLCAGQPCEGMGQSPQALVVRPPLLESRHDE